MKPHVASLALEVEKRRVDGAEIRVARRTAELSVVDFILSAHALAASSCVMRRAPLIVKRVELGRLEPVVVFRIVGKDPSCDIGLL